MYMYLRLANGQDNTFHHWLLLHTLDPPVGRSIGDGLRVFQENFLARNYYYTLAISHMH